MLSTSCTVMMIRIYIDNYSYIATCGLWLHHVIKFCYHYASYVNRLVALNLPNLLRIAIARCQRMDMITVFRIVRGLQGVPFENLFQFHNTITRGNGYKLYKHFCYLNLCKFIFSFSHRELLRNGINFQYLLLSLQMY